MQLTSSVVAKCCPNATDVENLTSVLNIILPKYNISTVDQIAAFLAQCGHESLDFTHLKENLNYSADALQRVWHSRFPTPEIAAQYARNPERIANKVYANRMGNGDEASGDGWKYHGRGAIQLTGHDNYAAFAAAIYVSMDGVIQYLETLRGAVESACWYWTSHNLNDLATKDDIVGLTKKINGGIIGLDDRTARFERCLAALKAA